MIGNTFLDCFGYLLLDLLQIVSPALIVLLVIGIFYAFLQILNAKFLEDSEQGFPELLVGSVSKTLTFFIEKLPTLLVIVVIMVGFSLIMNISNSFYKIYENQQRIKELTIFVKNLSTNDKITQIKVCDKGINENGPYGTYKINIYDGITGDVISEKTYQLNGNDLRLDTMIINFEYSEVGAGTQRNLAFPHKIFSNEISPANAKVLDTIFTSTNIDDFIEDDIDEMLGLSRDAFRKRAKEFIEIIKDPIKSQEIGIRSTYGNTITIPANAQINDEYVIYIEGTGGLSLRKVSW